MLFHETVTNWYSVNKRSLPWREAVDVYRVWLSEIIMQQTRVSQGLPYYNRFVELFPTVEALAEADEDKVLRTWQGLGYYSRARNLHKAAKIVSEEFKGEFPRTYKQLLSLPGVGDYTASAISSICFNERKGVLDGNVFRLFSRCFGIEEPIDTTWGRQLFKNKLEEELPHDKLGDFNQGIMELGALICTPKSPDCGDCPLRDRCVALKTGMIDKLPVKKSKLKKKKEFWLFSLVESDEKIQIRKRKSGIWKGLYELPNRIYFDNSEVPRHFLIHEEPIIHELSHKQIHAYFERKSKKQMSLEGSSDILEIKKSELENYAMPILIVRFLERVLN